MLRYFLTVLVLALAFATARADEGDSAACLAEINARRAAAHLPPYQFDQKLADGALLCAKWRAAHLCFGHCPGQMGDWGVAPAMLNYAKYGGCAAYPRSYGFLSCAMLERDCTYCGAVRVRGSDGKDYCHLFAR